MEDKWRDERGPTALEYEAIDARAGSMAYEDWTSVPDAQRCSDDRVTIDALVAALEAVSPLVHKLDARRHQIDAALALARGGK